MVKNNKTFVRITNQDIYEKLEEVIEHQKITNGRVNLNRWIATTALTLIISLFSIALGIKFLN